jgi:hypothetical protein
MTIELWSQNLKMKDIVDHPYNLMHNTYAIYQNLALFSAGT